MTIKLRPRYVARLDTDPELSGMTTYPSPKGGAKQDLPTLGSGNYCWCGQSIWHDYPGKSEGAPHPRAES